EHALTISRPREGLVYVEHNMRAQSVLRTGDEQNDRPNEALQTPRIGFSPAARNPRPVPHAATNHLRRAAWRTRIDETRAATRKFSAAWTNRRRQNGNGGRDDNQSVQRVTLVPFRHERISESRSAWPVAGCASR